MLVKKRRGRYGDVMVGRIGEARNEAVREVLNSFRDWFLSYNMW